MYAGHTGRAALCNLTLRGMCFLCLGIEFTPMLRDGQEQAQIREESREVL